MIFLVSDAHFGSGDNQEERETLFLQFLKKVQREGEKLIILGDLFDFWFEYRHYVNARYLPILQGLVETAQRVPTIYIAGNHDLWIGKFFEERGIKTVKEIHLEGDVAFAHGDNLKKGIRTRDILTNPLLVKLFYLLHPDWGYEIARLVSGTSRKRNKEVDRVPEWMWQYIQEKVPASTVVVGHLHVPIAEERNDRKVVCIGDWMRRYTYATIHDNTIAIYKHDGTEILRTSLYPSS